MRKEARFVIKLLSPRIIAKALTLLDKSTAVVVGVGWLVAIVTLVLAVLAVHGAVSSKREALDAVVSEPVLPKANSAPLSARDMQAILDRLQHQFPDIKFDVDNAQALTVKCEDGGKFHQWITAISYIDAMAPQYRWTLRDFCVGKCGQSLMKAVVTGQRVTFALPPAP